MVKSIRYIVFASVIAAFLAVPGATPGTLEFKLYREIYRDQFNVVGWMAERLASELSGHQRNPARAAQVVGIDSEPELVKRYLRLNEQITALAPRPGRPDQPGDPEAFRRLVEERDNLEPQSQAILRRQVEETLRDEGFTSDVGGRVGIYPPLLFAFTPLPKILVISPRGQIRIATTLALRPNLTWAEAETIEERASRMNVSALVVPIGGLGAYPPMIPRTSSLEFLARTIPHEWAHNYLTLRPLGFRYALQMEKDYEVVTMNESTASIIGEEIGDRLLSKYYGYAKKDHPRKPESNAEPEKSEPPAESDYNRRMRSIRLAVDDYLANGQIAEAEKYMAEEQNKLQADGYDVRKINQAFFAFYGSYATSPGFTNPLGDAVAELRYRSFSLKDFVDRIAGMRSYDEVKKAAAGN